MIIIIHGSTLVTSKGSLWYQLRKKSWLCVTKETAFVTRNVWHNQEQKSLIGSPFHVFHFSEKDLRSGYYQGILSSDFLKDQNFPASAKNWVQMINNLVFLTHMLTWPYKFITQPTQDQSIHSSYIHSYFPVARISCSNVISSTGISFTSVAHSTATFMNINWITS